MLFHIVLVSLVDRVPLSGTLEEKHVSHTIESD